MFRVVRNSTRNFGRGIKNIIVWFPVIWQQREWDDSFIIRLLYKKFELIEKHMKSDNCMASVHQDDYIKQVNICKNLCKRIVERDYLDNALTRHHELYGDECNWHFEPCKDKSGFSTLIFDETPQESASFRRAGKHSSMMEVQDYDYLFKMLHKHIRKWWD